MIALVVGGILERRNGLRGDREREREDEGGEERVGDSGMISTETQTVSTSFHPGILRSPESYAHTYIPVRHLYSLLPYVILHDLVDLHIEYEDLWK